MLLISWSWRGLKLIRRFYFYYLHECGVGSRRFVPSVSCCAVNLGQHALIRLGHLRPRLLSEVTGIEIFFLPDMSKQFTRCLVEWCRLVPVSFGMRCRTPCFLWGRGVYRVKTPSLLISWSGRARTSRSPSSIAIPKNAFHLLSF